MVCNGVINRKLDKYIKIIFCNFSDYLDTPNYATSTLNCFGMILRDYYSKVVGENVDLVSSYLFAVPLIDEVIRKLTAKQTTTVSAVNTYQIVRDYQDHGDFHFNKDFY